MTKNNNKTVTTATNPDFETSTNTLQEQLLSLSTIAQEIVAGAEKIKKTSKQRALEEARVEADAILSRAKEQAKQIINKKAAEAEVIIAKTQEQAQQMLEDTKREANALVHKQKQTLVEDVQQIKQTCTAAMSQLQNLKQEMATLETDLAQVLANIEKQVTPQITKDGGGEPAVADSEVSPRLTDKAPAQPLEQIDKKEQSDTKESESEPETTQSGNTQKTNKCDGDVELEIQPPVDMEKVKQISKYLSGLPMVETVNLIPTEPKPVIALSLQEPLDLVKRLKSLPEVSQVIEVKDGESSSIMGTGFARGAPKRMRVELWV